MLFANGQLEEALAEGRRALELNPGAGPDLTAMIACTLIRLGRFDEAGETIALMPPGNPRDFATSLLHQAPGGRKEADAALERLAAARKDVRDEVRLAEAYAWRGRNDEALDALVRLQKRLEQQRKRRDLWYLADEVRLSPYLRDLQADPRWARVADAPG
jgi:thioredoxin-like negative regulator of GroEL